MSVPFSNKWVAKLCLKECMPSFLSIPAFFLPLLAFQTSERPLLCVVCCPVLLAKKPSSEIIFSTVALLVSYLPCYVCTQDPTAACYFSRNTNKGKKKYIL